MFIINPYLRFALIGISILGGAALWATLGVWYGIFFILVGIVLLAGYIFLGTIGPASQALQTGDMAKTEKLLDLTFKPNWLYATNRAFYYMLKGSIALQRKDFEEGERYLKIADSIDLPSPNEKAMLQIQLAQLAASKGRWPQAQQYFKQAKSLQITEPTIKEQLVQLQQIMNQQGQSKAAMRMGKQGQRMMNPGGKRRRPKMR